METPLLSRADLLKFCTGRALTHSLSLTLEQRAVGGDFDRAACGVDQEFFNHSPAGLHNFHTQEDAPRSFLCFAFYLNIIRSTFSLLIPIQK
jgi:hypothetical protein